MYSHAICTQKDTRAYMGQTQGNLVDPASSHMLVLKIKPCKCKYEHTYGETANGSIEQ